MFFGLMVVIGAVVIAIRGRGGPAHVADVPATLPAGGAEVGGKVLLKPLASPLAHSLSEEAAVARARRLMNRFANKRRFPAAALEARLSFDGNKRLQDRPAWVVTFTYPKPTNVAVTGTALVTHASVALDAETGKFLVGFFTK
jgi:hypothetical protein